METVLLMVISLMLLALATVTDRSHRMKELVVNETRRKGWLVVIPKQWINRRAGLLNIPRMPAQSGLLIQCNQVHMKGMLCPLDLVALDAGGRIIALTESARPDTALARFPSQTKKILELAEGSIASLSLGKDDVLTFEDMI